MSDYVKTTYLHLVREFEISLDRKLTIDEEELLKRVAKRHALELKWDNKSK